MEDDIAMEFIVGEEYRYSEVPVDSTYDLEVNEYGPEYLGQNAIHLRFHKAEIDVWFIWIKQLNEGILKCVFNS
jgi:hypothetical protein